jgi:hypothetical protein
MPHLEPAYLRYIYDGLIKGSIHPENAAELPEGLIGLYEEAFDERQQVHKRQQLLERFAIWALLKKEVTAQFVAEVLNQPEEEIQEFIATYSAWFNSPESGKYQLYHESLKVYLLQKLNEVAVHELLEKLISRLELAIAVQKADEFEWYGLEFLGSHIFISDSKDVKLIRLTSLCENQNFTDRQINLSGHYEWPKMNFKYLAISGFKKNKEHIINSTLGLVKIHLKESSDVDPIFIFLKEERFELALFRIDSLLKNESKEDKFIFYFQLFEELLNKPWVEIHHISSIIEHFTKSIETIFYYNLDSLIVKHLKTLEGIWKRGIEIDILLRYFDFYKDNKIDFDKNYSTLVYGKLIYRAVGLDFAISFFSDNSKINYLSVNAKTAIEFETNLNTYGYAFQNFATIKNYIIEIKSLKFLESKLPIDLDDFGIRYFLHNILIERKKIDVFIDYLDQMNKSEFSKLKNLDLNRKIHLAESYLFFIDWLIVNEDLDKAEYYLNKYYYLLEHNINNLEKGEYREINEIVHVLDLAKALKRKDIILHIYEKTKKGFEIWKSWEDEWNIKEISCILMHKLIFDRDIEIWLNRFVFKEKNEFYINAILPYWPIDDLKIKKNEINNVSAKLIYYNAINKSDQEVLKFLLLKDLENDNFFKFFPFALYASETNDSKLIVELISRLEKVNKFNASYYLTYFEIKNREVMSNESKNLFSELSNKYLTQNLKENGDITKLHYLFTILELQLSLLDNKNAHQTVTQIKKIERNSFNHNDLQFFISLIKELIVNQFSNNEIKWQLVKIYLEFSRSKVFWTSKLVLLKKRTVWYLNYLMIFLNLLTKRNLKLDLNNSYISNFNIKYEFTNMEKNNLSYWIDRYTYELKNHLAQSMNSIDDETISLLRTYYGLNALKKDNLLKIEDYRFLQLQWTMALNDVNKN